MGRSRELAIPDVLLMEVDVYRDERGWFQEFWNETRVAGSGVDIRFVQNNHASSKHAVLRGLHFQNPFGQGKLITVLHGEIFDVAVDVRNSSPTFGKYVSATLAAGSGAALYIPPGFAHGYQVISDTAAIAYNCTETYHPEAEHCLLWNDPDVGIAWPIDDPILSKKDQAGKRLRDITPV